MIILDWMDRENAADYAIRVILHNIIHLELAPGSEISSNKLSEALSLSRMPVREALTALSRIGLVEILPQRGTYVSKIDRELVEESKFMRLVLETAIIRLACEGVEQKWINTLTENLAIYKAAADCGDHDKTLEIDNEFHRHIFSAVNKSWTYSKIKDDMVHFDRLRMLSMPFIKDKASETLREHEDILYAITRKDPEMGEMMIRRHLEHSMTEIDQVMLEYPDYFVKK